MTIFDSSPEVLSPQALASFDDEEVWQVIYDSLHPGKDTPAPGRCRLLPRWSTAPAC